MSVIPPNGEATLPPMPRGIHHVYIYEIFNTISWTVVIGPPMLLYFQHLNATATILAVASALTFILNILQIPAARFVEPIGYRRFVANGWTMRSFFIIGMALIAFLPPSVDRATRIVGMLFLSLVYNVIRGIATCGVLPWFTHIVPEERRGEFLAKDQIAGAMAAVVALIFFALILVGAEKWWAYGAVYTISAVCGFVSVRYLWRVPDVAVEKIVVNRNPVPWREMLLHPPFFHYIRYNLVINMALGASGVFWVRFFRMVLHVTASNVLLFSALTTLVLALGLLLASPVIDRAGSKPALALSGLLLTLHYLGWALIAAGVLPLNAPMLGLQALTSGLGVGLWNVVNVRAVMAIVPTMGRPHFLALYSVISNLTLGLVPLAWGPVMDALEHWHLRWGFWDWNSYSLLYAVLMVTVLVGLFLLRTVAEPAAMTWDQFTRELLVNTPARGISRLIGRLRGPGL